MGAAPGTGARDWRFPSMGPATIDSPFVDEIRGLMLQRVEAEVSERLLAAWKRGTRAAQALQTENEQSFASLTESLADVHDAQQSLEAENDRLRQVVATLASRLSQLGAAAAFVGPRNPGAGWATSTAESSGIAPRASPQALFTPTSLPSPVSECAASHPASPMEELWRATTVGGVSSPKLTNLPAFPFLSQPKQMPAIAAKVSLADVLGITTPAPETPSTSGSSGSPSSSSSSTNTEDVDAFIFGLTLRLADGTELGLTTSQGGRDCHLRIEGVLPGGAADAWNRQCGSSGAAEKVLLPGDKIVSVNDVAGDPQAMLLECGSRRLLRLQLVRTGGGPANLAPASPEQVISSARAATVPRAELPFCNWTPAEACCWQSPMAQHNGGSSGARSTLRV